MPATLSEKGLELLEDLPLGGDDPIIQGAIDAPARETVRVEAAALAIRAGAVPHLATDANGLLPVWELLLGLPIQPVGVPESARSSAVTAHFRARRAAAGSEWVALLSLAMGTTGWSHLEVAPYSVTILVPFGEESYTAEQMREIARRITPANLAINAVYDVGFILNHSLIGVDPL